MIHFRWPITFKPRNKIGRDFSEEDTDKSAITRLERAIRKQRIEHLRAKLEHMKAKQEEEFLDYQVQTLENDMYGDMEEENGESDGPEDPDSLLVSLLGNVFRGSELAGSQMGVRLPSDSSHNSRTVEHQERCNISAGAGLGAGIRLTDDELREFKNKVPKSYIRFAKKKSDEEIITFIRMHKPGFLEQYDQDTIQRAIRILKE